MIEKKVDFFIAGTQKGGTTALQFKLSSHPQLFLSGLKEIHFFDCEDYDWSNPPYEQLHAHFDFSQSKIFGEATPIYLYWPNAMQRLCEYNPMARIIIILRHPTYRALSAWKMETARNAEQKSFSQAVSLLGRSRVRLARGGVHRVYSYVERSYYSYQISRLLSLFPRKQVLFLTSDELWLDEVGTLNKIFDFLGVAIGNYRPSDQAQKYIVPVDSRHVTGEWRDTTMRLNKRFRRDIVKTEKLTGLKLSAWLDENYQEPVKTS
ncbi:Sulfotransferase domain-containing protein [Loktanella atrilutea]|uniref:Sulfotransferase domain-containing protein n=1 Tax=Loktanella atrilutea TaxID=366533 RepID=A0A1M4WGH3_LOKAT|nr:sulfotransferase [Loktanella atrilutea]SHE80052.1 Sulfotransferase domain-containing protein [Loktanella atrilutea]